MASRGHLNFSDEPFTPAVTAGFTAGIGVLRPSSATEHSSAATLEHNQQVALEYQQVAALDQRPPATFDQRPSVARDLLSTTTLGHLHLAALEQRPSATLDQHPSSAMEHSSTATFQQEDALFPEARQLPDMMEICQSAAPEQPPPCEAALDQHSPLEAALEQHSPLEAATHRQLPTAVPCERLTIRTSKKRSGCGSDTTMEDASWRNEV